MKLRVGANWDIAFLDAVKGTSVDALFGKLPFDIVGGARPGFVLPQVDRHDVERYIQACHDRGLEFSYLLNAPCLGNLQYSKKGYGQLIELLEWIDQSGADAVTVGMPYLIDLVRERFPRLKIKVSTTARVNTVRKTLEQIRKAVRCNLELILNNICLWQCPYNYEHVNHDGHSSREGEDDYCYLQYPGYLCLHRKLTDPVELLKSPWIRPEDVTVYEEIGYEHFKITERFKRTPLLLEHVRAYENRRYDGNLLDLFTKHVNIMKVSELGKVFDLEVRELIHLDNNKLNGFLEHFKHKDCNQTSCVRCHYCDGVFKKAATVDTKALTQAAKRVKDFSGQLISGEIFDIPKSHLIFRIPVIKSLLKKLVTWRLNREQGAAS
jgi:collagenase-like PrtC family protease